MGLLGKKKKDDGGEDGGRRGLFSSKKESKASAPPEQNPYANVPLDPYTQAKMRAGVIPSAGQPANASQSGGYSKAPYGQTQANPYGPSANGYGTSEVSSLQRGYGSNQLNNQSGYGAEKQSGNPYAQSGQYGNTSRNGGYGGLGSVQDSDADSNRDALFGGVQQKFDQQQQNRPPGYQYQSNDSDPSAQSYGAYGDRQLTAEEEEEEDVAAVKQDIKFMKQADVSSTRNALQAAAMAEETGRNTLARLGAQGERIYNTERNLDIGHNALNIAEDKSKELKKLNRSMFAVHVNNPFTAKDRRIQEEEKIMERHHLEREQREATRQAAYNNHQRMNDNFRGLDNRSGAANKPTIAERGKYQFEADSDDDRMEDEIEKNLDELSGAAGRLNRLARAMGDEADAQNAHLVRIADKSDRLDDRFHLQTERLKKIK